MGGFAVLSLEGLLGRISGQVLWTLVPPGKRLQQVGEDLPEGRRPLGSLSPSAHPAPCRWEGRFWLPPRWPPHGLPAWEPPCVEASCPDQPPEVVPLVVRHRVGPAPHLHTQQGATAQGPLALQHWALLGAVVAGVCPQPTLGVASPPLGFCLSPGSPVFCLTLALLATHTAFL